MSGPPMVKEEAMETAEDLKMDAVLEFLRKNNFKDAEAALVRQTSHAPTEKSSLPNEPPTAVTTNHLPVPEQPKVDLTVFKSEGDPGLYLRNYNKYVTFIDTTLDVYKNELAMLLFPAFSHMYLELIYNGHYNHAVTFFNKFKGQQETFYSEYVEQLAIIRNRQHMETNDYMNMFRSNKFVIRMSRETMVHMKRHLQDNRLLLMLTVVQERLFIDVYDGAPRSREQILKTSGGMLGEARRDANKTRVLYGLLKEPEINIPVDEDDDVDETDKDKPKKKKTKKDSLLPKKAKNDPNAPSLTRIPLPEVRDADKMEKIQSYKEAQKRLALGPDSLPSVCFYTFLNDYAGATCSTFTDDSQTLAAGFEDSTVKVWSLALHKLRSMKSGEDLSDLDREADDILERMMDDATASEHKKLVGHGGAIYAVAFSNDRQYLLSSSADGTVRLWSLLTWSNLVIYKGHNYPVFDVQFSPHGFYFVSGGHDRLARLWSTDHHQPLRMFAGHLADVDCVKFHHNSNYVATGSSDRCVRLFDMASGNCVRTMSGHKGSITCLGFSPCGKYLISGSSDCHTNIWDLSNGCLLAQLSGHTDAVISCAFSREGTLLATGGMDCAIWLWDLSALQDEREPPDGNTQQHPQLLSIQSLRKFPTKATPVMCLHFTRRNLLLANGAFRL